jgi:hypothetical protein
MVDPPPVAIATSGLRAVSDARTTPSAGVTAEFIADYSTAQSVIERKPKTLALTARPTAKMSNRCCGIAINKA